MAQIKDNQRIRRTDKITLICIPTLNEGGLLSDVSIHFGKTPFFTFINVEDGKIKDINVIESLGKHNRGAKTSAEIILGSGADVLICGNLGSKAVSILRENGIKVFSGASGKADLAFKEWKLGRLPLADKNSCNEKRC